MTILEITESLRLRGLDDFVDEMSNRYVRRLREDSGQGYATG